MSESRVCAVVLAYKRLDVLRECIAALRMQTRPVDEILVVDQSGRGSPVAAWLAGEPGLRVHAQENRGSAGGFATCIELACRAGHDWVWVFDEDGIAEPGALEALLRTPRSAEGVTAFVCSNILTPDGAVQQASVPEVGPTWYGTVLADRCVRVSRASWLGLLVRREAVERFGLPVAEFFIWHEDQEFTERLTREMRGYVVLDSLIVHKQSQSATNAFTREGLFKIGHGIRNEFGWTRLRLRGVRRYTRMMRLSAACVGNVLTRQYPAGALVWMARGWVFSPRIRGFGG